MKDVGRNPRTFVHYLFSCNIVRLCGIDRRGYVVIVCGFTVKGGGGGGGSSTVLFEDGVGSVQALSLRKLMDW